MKKVLIGVTALLSALLLVGLAVGFFMHAYRVTTVTVTLLEGAEEPHDIAVPGDPEAAPDYQLKLHYSETWVDCGTFKDTPMGAGLTWNVPENAPPASLLIEYKLVEVDRMLDDVLDQVPAVEAQAHGNSFAFTRSVAFSADAGWSWFFNHPLGEFMSLVALVTIFLLLTVMIVGRTPVE